MHFAKPLIAACGLVLLCAATQAQTSGAQPRQLAPKDKQALLTAREAVWRSFFTNDAQQLAALVPPDTIAINPPPGPGEPAQRWADQKAILADAKNFVQNGGKLVRLDFPRTEIQAYGAVAIIYTTYIIEIEFSGQRSTSAGFATEVFVKLPGRNGRWVNPGWHMDADDSVAKPTPK